ncbi:MAG: hypothetical protein FD180_3311 [Planctomycetota bacterium]|nr:MAG: hypothetical protein FD180_3311 [Planctomycetota bacterium]
MKLLLAVVGYASLMGGCAFMTPKPPPVIAEPPRGDTGGDPKSPARAASGQEIPGYWVSKSVSGPGAPCVCKVEVIFEGGGVLSGTMLIEAEGRKRFASLAGTWKSEEGKLAITYADGRARTWSVAWDAGVLILKDGEAEMRMERAPE